MANEVKIEYDQMQNITSIFEDHSQRAQSLLQKINAQVETLRGGAWIGVNADKFYREMDNDMMVSLQRLIKAFDESAQTTARIEQVLRAAEDEASAIFRTV